MNQEMDQTTALVVNTTLNEMVAKGYIDICTIRILLKLLGMTPPEHEFTMLQALHCMNFGVMPTELQQRIPGLLSAVFSGYVMPNIKVVEEPSPKTISGFMGMMKFK